MKKVKVGLVGCGAIAESQANGLKNIDTADFAAVCDLREDLAKAMAEKYQVPNVYTDYAEMLKTDIQAVVICTPKFLHRDHAVQAAEAGKHLLVQKPFAMNLEQADEIIAAARKNKVILQAAFFERFYSFNLKMKELLDSGKYGRPLMMRTQFSHTGIDKFWLPKTDWFHDKTKSGGGPLGDLGAHHFDVITWLLGSAAQSVSATTTSMLETGGNEDNAATAVLLENGVMAQSLFSFTTVGPKGYCYEKFEIYCEEGSIICSTVTSGVPKIWVATKEMDSFEEVPYTFEDPWVGMEGHFVDCIQQGRQPITPGEAGRRSLEIIHGCYASAESGKAVTLQAP